MYNNVMTFVILCNKLTEFKLLIKRVFPTK